MVDLRRSCYVLQGVFPPEDQHLPQKFRPGFGHGEVVGRTYGIGAFLNNYEMTVDQMASVDPLPLLVPVQPFPDPYKTTAHGLEGASQQPEVGKWPCRLEDRKVEVKNHFPLQRDWMHDWAEYMYRNGEFGAKTKK